MRGAESSARVSRRAVTYAIVSLGLLLAYFPVSRSVRTSSSEMHTLLETVATILALFVALIALVRYHSRRSDGFLFLGAAFVGATVLDSYHTLISSTYLAPRLAEIDAGHLFNSPVGRLAAWSWLLSRLLVSILLWQAARLGSREATPEAGRSRSRRILVTAALTAAIGAVALALVPLPPYSAPIGPFGRPQEVLPAVFFSLALVACLRRRAWAHDPFEHWLVLSLLFSVFLHFPHMAFTANLNNSLFDFVHVLKIASYAAVMIGLVFSMDALFRQADESGQSMARANLVLRREIAERQQAEEALRASEEHVRMVAESAIEAIISTDSRGHVILWNKAAERMFGYPATEVMGRAVTMLMPERYRDAHNQGVERARLRPSAQFIGHTVELHGLTKDGHEFPIEVSLAMWRTRADAGYTAIMRDTSGREQAKQELVESHQRLADSREAERLHVAQELHDGPLQDLYGVRLHLGDVPGEAGARAQADLQAIIDRLRQICHDVRPPALMPFGLEVAIRSHAERFRAAHPEIHLELDLEPDRQQIPERTRLALYRIYQQALANIAQHADAQHARVSLSLHRDQIALTIRDDGRGFIPPARWLALARRGHLGLLGASERAEGIGGRLEVVSAPGDGTLIRVTAPTSVAHCTAPVVEDGQPVVATGP